MRELLHDAERVATLLTQRRETIAVAESSAGGLIAAALIAVPGASTFCRGGVVLYTRSAWHALREFSDDLFAGIRPATEPHALVRARVARDRFDATWGLGETGATGPTGNRYGDPAGHACFGVSGAIDRAITLRTASTDRYANMHAFAKAALEFLADCLAQADKGGTHA